MQQQRCIVVLGYTTDACTYVDLRYTDEGACDDITGYYSYHYTGCHRDELIVHINKFIMD